MLAKQRSSYQTAWSRCLVARLIGQQDHAGASGRAFDQFQPLQRISVFKQPLPLPNNHGMHLHAQFIQQIVFDQ